MSNYDQLNTSGQGVTQPGVKDNSTKLGGLGASGDYGSSNVGGNVGQGSLDDGVSNDYGSSNIGGNVGQDALGSGAADQTGGLRKEEGGLDTTDPYGSRAGADPDPALSTTAVAGDTAGSAIGGRAQDTSTYGGADAGGVGANTGYSTQGGAGGGDFTGAGSGFTDTAAAGGAHTGANKGDSKVGRAMEKAGEVLHSDTLQGKGRERRDAKQSQDV